MQIFAEGHLSEFLERRLAAMRSEIHNEPRNCLLNVNEEAYIEYVVECYRIKPLELQWDDIYVTDSEELIPAEHFPPGFHVYEGERYPKQVITYYIPFEGESDLFRYAPSHQILWSTEIIIGRNHISFDIVNWRDDPDEIKGNVEDKIRSIRSQNDNVRNEVSAFNDRLRETVRKTVQARKQKHLKQLDLLTNLGVSVKKSEHTPETFSIPSVKRKVIVKPTAPNTAFEPEPALDDSLYRAILRVCYEAGVEMERHPSVYADKDEETLRDHFIMVLSPHFDSVTGETFNRSGKTDILIRHEGANVFVAECKFWSGQSVFQKTIDQVLGYLTWRDSKAAILNLVRNNELDPVLQQIEPVTAVHPCFVARHEPEGEGWYNFRFHLPKDNTRGVSLAVLCFHLAPK